MPVQEPVAVNIRQRTERRLQHFAHLLGRERPSWNNLRQAFFGVLHQQVNQRVVAQVGASHRKDAHQMRMRQIGHQVPTVELEVRHLRISEDDLDRGFLWSRLPVFGEEYSVVSLATQIPVQGEGLTNALTFILLPGPGHCSPSPAVHNNCNGLSHTSAGRSATFTCLGG